MSEQTNNPTPTDTRERIMQIGKLLGMGRQMERQADDIHQAIKRLLWQARDVVQTAQRLKVEIDDKELEGIVTDEEKQQVGYSVDRVERDLAKLVDDFFGKR